MIVLLEPVIDDDLGLLGCGEPFGIEHLPAECAIEPFVVPILPRRPRRDADWLDTNSTQPVLHCFSSELRPVV